MAGFMSLVSLQISLLFYFPKGSLSGNKERRCSWRQALLNFELFSLGTIFRGKIHTGLKSFLKTSETKKTRIGENLEKLPLELETLLSFMFFLRFLLHFYNWERTSKTMFNKLPAARALNLKAQLLLKINWFSPF